MMALTADAAVLAANLPLAKARPQLSPLRCAPPPVAPKHQRWVDPLARRTEHVRMWSKRGQSFGKARVWHGT